MRGRLITNGILSICSLVFWIIAIVAIANTSSVVTNTDGSTTLKTVQDTTETAIVSIGVAWLIMTSSWFASFIMGIVTLSMKKDEKAKGFAIASGVIAILGGLFGVNAIVSFIGAYKASKKS